jgi:2-polyprenyl-6-methoxyphenol hydroxylase-like FAD-dependent oxidoreductase
MSQNPDRSVLIIGGGIGGLAASIALQNAGLSTLVFEATPAFTALGVSVSISPNGMKSLRALGHGIVQKVESVGRPLKSNGALRLVDPEGNPVGAPSDLDVAGKYGDPIVVIRRLKLHDYLIGAQQAGTLHANKRLTGLRDDGSHVTAIFADGTTATGDILIGADGLHSVVRKVLHGTEAPRYTGWGNLRGLANDLKPPDGYEDGIVILSDQDHVLVLPLGDGGCYISCAFKTPVDTWPRDPEAAWREVLRRCEGWYFCPEAVRSIDRETLLAREIRDHNPLESWAVGRSTLLGDAAHAMSNFWGQGANTSLEDAVVLARCFDDGQDGVSALLAYERARITRTSVLQEASARVDGHTRDNEAFVAWQYTYDPRIASLEPPETSFEELLAIGA